MTYWLCVDFGSCRLASDILRCEGAFRQALSITDVCVLRLEFIYDRDSLLVVCSCLPFYFFLVIFHMKVLKHSYEINYKSVTTSRLNKANL